MFKAHKDALRFAFYRRLKLELNGTKVTSDAGLLAYRELDEILGLTSAIERDIRTGKKTQHGLTALLRQSIYSRLTGCEKSDDCYVWPTYDYFELLDGKGNQVAEPGQRGEIVGTGFINTVMPFIRYRTGDWAAYVGDHCEA